METLKFKTTLKCSGCVTKVTSGLNKIAGEGNWGVDLENTPKVLTVTAAVSDKEIKAVLEENGFEAERV
ncbi:heavy-metal-associated domain-containing protein [Albibacterium bauzanense]|uniref:Copper chaperone CopZ n=1 Tax=Albibacterium bauzanense TaxID=653929 RepID=A0A4R1LUW1_9SPHI|nr:cation transporter [Albibacterium bauzanense]TCK83156.1 copper chaperone CopZ [Albibacterium bauzanense]